MKNDNKTHKNVKEQMMLEMFSKLSKNIGKDVTCQGFWCSQSQKIIGKLDEIKYFENVSIDESVIPFIGYGTAIYSIFLNDTGEELYFNPYFENDLKSYSIINIADLFKAKRYMFGDDVVDRQLARKKDLIIAISKLEKYKEEFEKLIDEDKSHVLSKRKSK